MKKMKMVQFKEILGDNFGLSFVVLSIVLLLIGSMVAPSFTAVAEENDGVKVEVPQWKVGYTWTYQEKIPMPEMGHIESDIELKVTAEREEFVNIGVEDGEDLIYDTYEVVGTMEGEEGPMEIKFQYTQENIAEVYNDPDWDVPSAYVPPIVMMDFPLYVGKEWDDDETFYYINPEEEGFTEPKRHYWYMGRVEEEVTREVNSEEFETYMINLTVGGEDLDGDSAVLNRYELYYSPEVKNVVHKDMYAVQRLPDDYGGPGDGDEVREEWTGNETLLDYSLEADEEEEEVETSLLGVGVVLVIIGVGTASFIVYKKVKTGL